MAKGNGEAKRNATNATLRNIGPVKKRLAKLEQRLRGHAQFIKALRSDHRETMKVCRVQAKELRSLAKQVARARG